jgi:hypothetical protein
MTLKPYIVATNTDITCICLAKNKRDAVAKCKRQYKAEFGSLYPEIWEAYDFIKYFTDQDEYYRNITEDVLLLQSAYLI